MNLTVYVQDGCGGCARALALAGDVRQEFPQIDVAIVDIDEPAAFVPESVFAVPTYTLDGRIISLGNPARQWLMQVLRERWEKAGDE